MLLLLVLIHFDREWCLQLKTHLINFIQLRMAPEDWVGPDGNVSLSPGCERAIRDSEAMEPEAPAAAAGSKLLIVRRLERAGFLMGVLEIT